MRACVHERYERTKQPTMSWASLSQHLSLDDRVNLAQEATTWLARHRSAVAVPLPVRALGFTEGWYEPFDPPEDFFDSSGCGSHDVYECIELRDVNGRTLSIDVTIHRFFVVEFGHSGGFGFESAAFDSFGIDDQSAVDFIGKTMFDEFSNFADGDNDDVE